MLVASTIQISLTSLEFELYLSTWWLSHSNQTGGSSRQEIFDAKISAKSQTSKGKGTGFVSLEFPSNQIMLYDVSAFLRPLSDITYTVHRSQSFSNYHVIYTYNINSTPIHHKLNLPISIVNKRIITFSFSQLPTISLHPVTKPQLQLLEPSVWTYQAFVSDLESQKRPMGCFMDVWFTNQAGTYIVDCCRIFLSCSTLELWNRKLCKVDKLDTAGSR